jgi:hypothetical protein
LLGTLPCVILPDPWQLTPAANSSFHRLSHPPVWHIRTSTRATEHDLDHMSSSPRAAWRLFETIFTRSCQLGRQAPRNRWPRKLGRAGHGRPVSTSSPKEQHAGGTAPHMDQMRAVYKQRNRTTMYELVEPAFDESMLTWSGTTL